MSLPPRRARRFVALALSVAALVQVGCGGSSTKPGSYQAGQPLTIDVSATFPAGTVVRDQYSGATATVSAGGSVTLQPDAAGGVVLLERDGAAATPFTWQNATVYFAMTDRFANGDATNDASYGRAPDAGQVVGTWQGGDFAGLTQKLPYLSDLGVTAIWISPVVEQVHGWVGGGPVGEFQHYAYHGYWALDFTRLDKNFGTEAELKAFIDQAHARGIRVVVDVVMNHPGYATGNDLLTYLPEVFKAGGAAAFGSFTPVAGNYYSWNDLVDYQSTSWTSWWTPPWVRAGFPGFPQASPSDPLTMSLASLPDFGTEATVAAGMPVLLQRKALTADGTGAALIAGYTVRQYLVKWHTDWVSRLGIDGFRADTAKHVELGSWKALKDAGGAALAAWKTGHPGQLPEDLPFWMTGEVFPHGPVKDAYYTEGGFDSLINFDFQDEAGRWLGPGSSLLGAADKIEALWASYSAGISADPGFDVLSYLSSHDTSLFFQALQYDPLKQRQAGTALLLTPGGVQIFYGDESGRRAGPGGGDTTQPTRSFMNWTSIDATIHDHWQKLATFRKRHAAVGAGVHQKLASPPGTYAFSRTRGADKVVVILTPTR
jgi:alpha-amylase